MENCQICSSSKGQSVYYGPLRSGTWGHWTHESIHIHECSKCHVKFMAKNNLNTDYQSDDYINEFRPEVVHQPQLDQLKPQIKACIKLLPSRDLSELSALDIGGGNGELAHALSSRFRQVDVIEPSRLMREQFLSSFNHYPYLKDFLKQKTRVDVALSMNVIEHVENPKEFLDQIHRALKSDGELILMTPNDEDLLNQMIPQDFHRYYYRTAHRYYFSKQSIQYLLNLIGFKNIQIHYHHQYGIENLLQWALAKVPGNSVKLPLDFEVLNDNYKNLIEQKGLASHMLIKCFK